MSLQRILKKAKEVRFIDEPDLVPIVNQADWQGLATASLVALQDEFGEESPYFRNFKKILDDHPRVCTKETFESAMAIVRQASLPRLPAAESKRALDHKYLALIHPVIAQSSLAQYRDGHLRDAVLNGVTGLFDFIRERSGSARDGEPLVEEVLSLTKPILILSEVDTDSGKNDQVGFMFILKGVYRGVRNPKAHSLDHDLNDMNTRQYLVFLSLLARRIDEARKV